jgi:hypothetical protein
VICFMDVEPPVTAMAHPRELPTTLPFRRMHNLSVLLRPLKRLRVYVSCDWLLWRWWWDDAAGQFLWGWQHLRLRAYPLGQPGRRKFFKRI